MALTCAFTWSVSVILFKQSEGASTLSINVFKNVVALVLLGTTLLVTGTAGVERSGADWARLLVSGVIGIALADVVFFAALRRLGPGLLAVVECAYAPQVVLLAVVMNGEALSWGFGVGAALVLCGVAIVTIQPGAVGVAQSGLLPGILLALLAISLMAFGIVLAKPALASGHLVEVSFIRVAAGNAALALWVAPMRARGEILSILRPSAVWRTLLPASILGSYVSMILWIGGNKYTSASVAGVLNQLTTVFTLILARIFLGERLTPRRVVGGGAALAGALVILLAA